LSIVYASEEEEEEEANANSNSSYVDFVGMLQMHVLVNVVFVPEHLKKNKNIFAVHSAFFARH
jgi:hypothetical protein